VPSNDEQRQQQQQQRQSDDCGSATDSTGLSIDSVTRPGCQHSLNAAVRSTPVCLEAATMRRQQDIGGVGDQELPVDHEDLPCDANLSAELRYEAPLATFDGDEWTEFLLDVPPPPVPPDNDFRFASDVISGDTSPSSTFPRLQYHPTTTSGPPVTSFPVTRVLLRRIPATRTTQQRLPVCQ